MFTANISGVLLDVIVVFMCSRAITVIGGREYGLYLNERIICGVGASFFIGISLVSFIACPSCFKE